MSDKPAGLDVAYVQAKRQQLLKLRTEIQRLANAAEAEETRIRAEPPREAHEYEDDAEELDMLERQGLLVNRSVEQLARIERAFAKIANGTYGYSHGKHLAKPCAAIDQCDCVSGAAFE